MSPQRIAPAAGEYAAAAARLNVPAWTAAPPRE